MAQMKEQIKAPEKIQLRDEEIVNLSNAEFKILGIRMLTELVDYGRKLEEKAKAMKSEIKENVQGINSEGKQMRTQINGLDQKEEINIQSKQKEETGQLQAPGQLQMFQHPNHRGARGEEEEQD